MFFSRKLIELFRYRELLLLLVLRELKARYRGSFLGFLWTFVTPLVMFLVYYVLFSLLTERFGMQRYDLFLLSGYIPWVLFQQSVAHSTPIYRQSGMLLRMVYFPRALLPLSVVVGVFVHGIPAFLLLLLFSAYRLGAWKPAFLQILFLWLPLFLLGLGFGCLFAVLTVYFRDTEHIVNVLLTIWFFGTPIFYAPETVFHKLPEIAAQWGTPVARLLEFLFTATPMLYAVSLFHRPFYQGLPAEPRVFLIATLWGILISLVGLGLVFWREGEFAERV